MTDEHIRDLCDRVEALEERVPPDAFRTIYDGLAGLTNRVRELEKHIVPAPVAKAWDKLAEEVEQANKKKLADLNFRVAQFVTWIDNHANWHECECSGECQAIAKLRELGLIEKENARTSCEAVDPYADG